MEIAAERPTCAIGKRNGGPQAERAADADYLAALDPLVQLLNVKSATGGPKFDRKSLALMIQGLQQFMEDALGVNALYKPYPRLPAELLADTSPDGSLGIIAAACAEHMRAKSLKRIDWQAPQMRKDNMELFGRIRAELLRNGYVRTPHVYVHPSCGAAVPKLQEAVRSMKGEVAQSEGGSGVTHVVHPFGDKGDPDAGARYARTLEVKGGEARVHWLYLPDSYDEWVPASAAPASVTPPRRPPRGPWHVYVRWLTDSEKYNEWMNPQDYETEGAAEAEAKRKREGDEDEGGRKAKAARQAGPLPEIQVGAGQAVADGVTKQQVLAPKQHYMDPASAVDISQGQRMEGVLMPQAAVQVPPDMPARLQAHGQQQQQPGDGAAAAAAGGQAQGEQQGAADAAMGEQQAAEQGRGEVEAYLVPACAAWFRWDGIADVEEAHFKDFLAADPVGNPERYREYRNAIINKYREDMSRELSFTEARRALVGDVNLLRRIWAFLASWQLINFLARRQGPPGRAASRQHGEAIVQGSGFSTLSTSGADALYAGPRRASLDAGLSAALFGNVSGSGSVRVKSNVFGNWTRQPALANKVEFYCRGADCGAVCTELRHHCLKKPDLDLCPKCFKEGKFPPGMSARDFIRLEAADAVPDESGWTDQETLLLLEGIEKYGESWQQVAEHVGGKTAMQCVARFLQLPTEEALLADAAPGPHNQGLVAIPPPGQSDGLADAAAVLEEVIPFADVNNPVMAQVGFLAALVGPKIAAAAAQKALETLAEEDAAVAAAVAEGLAAEGGGGDVAMAEAGAPKNGESGAADGPISAARVRLAAATGLAGAAVQAKLLADQEEREVQRLVLSAVEQQFKKVQAKLQYLEELDEVLAGERLGMEGMRVKFLDEYERMVAENVKAGLGPPPGRAPPAGAAAGASTGTAAP